MSDDELRDEKAISIDIWDIVLRPLECRERVAADIVNLLAERNVCIADVDRIFALVKGYIGVIQLGKALPIIKREICEG